MMEMKKKISLHQTDATELEALYQQDKQGFKLAFQALYPELEESGLLQAWNARLGYASVAFNWGKGKEIRLVAVLALIAGVLTQLPTLFSWEEDQFFAQNISFHIHLFINSNVRQILNNYQQK